jgi:hypothetical protein
LSAYAQSSLEEASSQLVPLQVQAPHHLVKNYALVAEILECASQKCLKRSTPSRSSSSSSWHPS